MQIQTVNPATEEIIQDYETMPQEEVFRILDQSREAFGKWRAFTVSARAPYFLKLSEVLRRNTARYARLMTTEMGKPIRESRAEVEKCAWLCEVYAQNGEVWLREESVIADGNRHFVAFEPLGPILSIMPWNFPFWQALRFGVPTLLAGNTSILKHASNVPQCALAIEEAFREADFPPDIFRTVLADHATVGALMASDNVQGVSLTGSTAAGARIAETAGRNLKKVVLELGGSDPFIVLEDADIEFAARGAVLGRMINAGQSCIAAKRFIVVARVAEVFTDCFAERVAKLVVGDPLNEHTEVGPLVNADARRELEEQLSQSVARGGVVCTGGARLDRQGYFFAPTVVSRVTIEMRIVQEEVFGPIAPVIVAEDESEAIEMANASDFGLGASVWTRDLERGVRFARRLEAGTVFVNSVVKSDPRMPFGGVKKSGLGRELSKYGLREFVNVKGINVYEHEPAR